MEPELRQRGEHLLDPRGDRRRPYMDTAYISAFAALGGSAVGALTSLATTWFTLNSQERANRAAREMTRRETLYGQFIEEAAKLYTDALMNEGRTQRSSSACMHLRAS